MSDYRFEESIVSAGEKHCMHAYDVYLCASTKFQCNDACVYRLIHVTPVSHLFCKIMFYSKQFELEETSADKADSIQNYESKLTYATRSVDEMKRALDQATSKQVESETKADELKRENEILTKKVEGENDVADNQDYAALLKKVQDLEVMNAKLQKEAKDPSTNEAFQRELSGAKQVSAKEMSSLRSMLRARDDAIQSLQQRLEKSKEEMTDLEAEVDTLRSQSKLTEEKSKGELGNLWKLNDEVRMRSKYNVSC